MDWEEPKKIPANQIVLGESLATLSIAELEKRIDALKTEIARVEAEVTAKRRHEELASSLFKK